MAKVLIDSGPVRAEDRLCDVPRERWRDLMLERKYHMQRRLSYDCRCLVEFVNDAEVMFEQCGFGSVEAMIREGYGLEPGEITVALEWLKLNPPTEPISLKVATKLGAHGRPKKGEEKGSVRTFKRGEGRAYILARLERDHPELAERVKANAITHRAAAIETGIIKPPTPLEKILKLLPKLTATERRQLRARLDEAMKARAA